MTHLTFAEAIIVGLIQGTTELFPVSSLGHNVLIPAIVGGSWAQDLNVSKAESPYLAFVVGLHVATAIGITVYFWRDWVRIIGGFFTSIARMEVKTPDQKLAWMIVLATIPVGLVGLAFEHQPQAGELAGLLAAGTYTVEQVALRRRQAAGVPPAETLAVLDRLFLGGFFDEEPPAPESPESTRLLQLTATGRPTE